MQPLSCRTHPACRSFLQGTLRFNTFFLHRNLFAHFRKPVSHWESSFKRGKTNSHPTTFWEQPQAFREYLKLLTCWLPPPYRRAENNCSGWRRGTGREVLKPQGKHSLASGKMLRLGLNLWKAVRTLTYLTLAEQLSGSFIFMILFRGNPHNPSVKALARRPWLLHSPCAQSKSLTIKHSSIIVWYVNLRRKKITQAKESSVAVLSQVICEFLYSAWGKQTSRCFLFIRVLLYGSKPPAWSQLLVSPAELPPHTYIHIIKTITRVGLALYKLH